MIYYDLLILILSSQELHGTTEIPEWLKLGQVPFHKTCMSLSHVQHRSTHQKWSMTSRRKLQKNERTFCFGDFFCAQTFTIGEALKPFLTFTATTFTWWILPGVILLGNPWDAGCDTKKSPGLCGYHYESSQGQVSSWSGGGMDGLEDVGNLILFNWLVEVVLVIWLVLLLLLLLLLLVLLRILSI